MEEKAKRDFRIKSTFYDLIDNVIDTLVSEINEGKQTKLTEDFQKYVLELISITEIQGKKEKDTRLANIFNKQKDSLKSLLFAINEVKRKVKAGEHVDSSSIRNSAEEFKRFFKEEIAYRKAGKDKEAA